jgi:nicotinate dehydrogenase subunit B
MLHGRVVRPPYAGFDYEDHVGRSLIRIDEASVARLPGVVAAVVVGDCHSARGLNADRRDRTLK